MTNVVVKKQKRKAIAKAEISANQKKNKSKELAENNIESKGQEIAVNNDTGIDDWWAPSPQQTRVALMLANPYNTKTKTEIIKKVGISSKTFYKWVRDKRFVDYVNTMFEQHSDIDLRTAYKALKRNIKKGDNQAIRTFLELKGKLGNSKLSVRTTVPTDDDKVTEVEVVLMED